MTTINPLDDAFMTIAEQAVDALGLLAGRASDRAREDRPDKGDVIWLAADAFMLAQQGIALTGPRPAVRPDAAVLPDLLELRDQLVEHTNGLDPFEVHDFVGRLSDLCRDLVRCELV